MLLLAAAFLVAFVLLLYMVSPLISPKPLALPGAHVVVSGLLLLRRRRPARSAAPSPPPGAPARDRGPAAGVPFTAEGHLPPRGRAPSLRGAAGTRPPPQLALPAVCVWGGPGAPGAREPLVNPRGIRGMWIFLRSVFSMSQLRNGEAEKLCQGHRGRWPRRARRAVPAGSRGGGRQGRGPSRQDPPRRLGTGRRTVRVTERLPEDSRK